MSTVFGATVRPCGFFFSSRRRHTRYWRDWSSDVCSSDLGGGDAYDNAQDRSSLLGKLLRIDVEPTGNQPYGIPADNPFAEAEVVQSNQITDVIGETEGLNLEAAYYHPEARREIWAYGLRNPWQFSWDTEAGDLYI